MVLAHDLKATKRTQDIKTNQDVLFDALLLSDRTLQGLNEAGFYKPSPVQLHGIPMGKCGFDLLLEAKSGTGKTIVFTVIALEKMDLQKGLQAIMLAPTREIASQICDVIKTVGVQYLGLCVEVVMGGLPLQDDINKFKIGRNVHVVVGSPGRLRHLIQDNYIDTSAVRLLVLDEADKLIEKSFQADINFIFSSLPSQKQVVMSSATFSDTAKEFISNYVKEPQHVCPDSTSVLLGIEQKVSLVNTNTNIVKQTYLRYQELIKILTSKDFKQCLIFCNYQARVADLYKLLTRDKWPCEQLYGLQQQTDRLDALKTLQEYKCRILVSTDLAARGIDASNVDLVINFEPPYEWQTYLHRIGRAGRYGSYGTAVSIVSIGKEETKFKETLSIMHGSLNISYFWEDIKYVLNNENGEPHQLIKPQITGTHDHKNRKPEMKLNLESNNYIKENNLINTTNGASMFEYLWGQNNNHIKVEIENFNDLAKSFNDSQSLYKFEDLLKSLENHDSNKDDVIQELKKIQINEEQIIKCINHLNISAEIRNKLSNFNNTKNYETNGEVLEPRITNGNEIKCDESTNKLKSRLYEIDKKENLVHSTYNSKIITNSDPEPDEISNEEQSEMIRLGLPTSFYSKADKYADHKQQWKKPTENVYNRKIENIQPNYSKQVDSDNANKISISKTNELEKSNLLETNYEHTHKKPENKEFIKQKICEDSRISTKNLQIKNTKKSIKWNSQHHEIPKPQYENHAQINEKGHETFNPVNKDRNKTSERETRVNRKETNKDDYTLWYNALKIRTMQLEQIFYLEEMSQIK